MFQAEDGIRDLVRSRGLGDVYKRQVPVYNARIHLGRNLAKQIRGEIDAGRMNPDVVVPVPETARIAAIALSEAVSYTHLTLPTSDLV